VTCEIFITFICAVVKAPTCCVVIAARSLGGERADLAGRKRLDLIGAQGRLFARSSWLRCPPWSSAATSELTRAATDIVGSATMSSVVRPGRAAGDMKLICVVRERRNLRRGQRRHLRRGQPRHRSGRQCGNLIRGECGQFSRGHRSQLRRTQSRHLPGGQHRRLSRTEAGDLRRGQRPDLG